MSPKLSEIVAAIIAAVQVAHATVDLSDTDAVKYGEYNEPPVRPFVALLPPTGESEPEAVETWHRHKIKFTLRLWSTTADDLPSDRAERATAMLDEVMGAIALARRTSGNKLRNAALLSFPDYQVVATDADDASPYGEIVVEIEFRRSAGVGS